jgi:hypothetical protein
VFFEKDFSFFLSTTTRIFASIRIASAMDKQPSKRRRLATDTRSYKEEMESELNRKLPKRGSGSHTVQTAPLTEESVAPVEVQPTSVPTFDGTSNMESQGVNPVEGYDYGARYGGYQSTRFNSLLVNDDKADARAEWRYNRHRYAVQAAGYAGPYSVPYSVPSAQSRGFCAPYVDSQRESQASPSLDCIKRIMECMERQQAAATSASTASTVQLHALFGQGKFLSFHWNFELFEICSFSCIPFHRAKGIVPLSTLMESIWVAAGSLAVCSICFRFKPEFRLVAPYVCF